MILDCPKCGLRHVILDRASGTLVRCDCGTEITLPHSRADLEALKCANCGGNPPRGANHCPYCDAQLATLRCGCCYSQSIEGDRHCRGCGHELATPVRKLRAAPARILTCPRCRSELVSVLVDDSQIDECTRCGGVWLGHDLFAEILKNRDDHDAFLAQLRSLAPVTRDTAATDADQPFYIKCPQCDDIMDRRHFAKVSGVIVDVCGEHGIWFEKDELTAIIQFVGTGGLVRTAEFVHSQRVAEMREARRQYMLDSAVPTTDRIKNQTTGDIAEAVIEILLIMGA